MSCRPSGCEGVDAGGATRVARVWYLQLTHRERERERERKKAHLPIGDIVFAALVGV